MSKPYRNKDRLKRLYYDELRSIGEMSDILDCSRRTVTKWMDKFDLERRDASETKRKKFLRNPDVSFLLTGKGYEEIRHKYEGEIFTVRLHRLIAVSEYGLEAVNQGVVHHRNSIPWDNRPSNLSLLTRPEHRKHHLEEQSRGDDGTFTRG